MTNALRRYVTDFVFVIINLAMTILACIFLKDLEKIIKVVAVLLFLSLCIFIPSINNNAFYKLLLSVSVALSIFMVAYIALSQTGFLYILEDFDIIKDLILKTKQWGILVFLFLTIFQVVVLPIPGAITILIGVAIYGPFWSFILSIIGIFIGSVISFFLGRTFGKKLVCWMFGKENTEKYANFLNEKGRGMFIIMLLFPIFPDDLLCMLAGISSMKFKFFAFSVLLTRPVMTAATAFLGSGQIIPFKGWGIPVWISLLLLAVILFIIINHIKNKLSLKKKK